MTTTAVARAGRTRIFGPFFGASVFLVAYLLVSPVSDAIAPLPLPGAPVKKVYDYFTETGTASIVTGILQLLSVAGLAVFVTAIARRLPVGPPRRNVRALGWIAVAAMVASSVIAIALGATAAALTPDTVVAWRQASFYAGGVVHIVVLGVLALTVALRRSWTRPVRVMAWIAAVPAVLSIASLIWYYASILLPAGRVLAMLAFVVAGVSLARARSLATVDSPQG